MRIKPGASLDHASAELLHGIAVVEEEFRRAGLEATVTSCYRAGPWGVTLLHGTDRDPKRAHRKGVVDACDFSYPLAEKAPAVIAAIRARLSKPAGAFDVLDERTNASAAAAGVGGQWTGAHLHIEFDPTPAGG
jgi:hypothetical protein